MMICDDGWIIQAIIIIEKHIARLGVSCGGLGVEPTASVGNNTIIQREMTHWWLLRVQIW